MPDQVDRFANWRKDEGGNIILNPLVGFQTATGAQMICLVRLEFAPSLQQIGKDHEGLQLGMTPQQAREVGEALLRAADQIEPTGSGRLPRNLLR